TDTEPDQDLDALAAQEAAAAAETPPADPPADPPAEEEAAEPDTVRRWARDGVIPAIRISSRAIRFDVSEVMRTLRSNSGRNQ
ncbi:MAG: helix-turn-helix domain-containing protein, partial [Planctomycetota bacterium]